MRDRRQSSVKIIAGDPNNIMEIVIEKKNKLKNKSSAYVTCFDPKCPKQSCYKKKLGGESK